MSLSGSFEVFAPTDPLSALTYSVREIAAGKSLPFYDTTLHAQFNNVTAFKLDAPSAVFRGEVSSSTLSLVTFAVRYAFQLLRAQAGGSCRLTIGLFFVQASVGSTMDVDLSSAYFEDLTVGAASAVFFTSLILLDSLVVDLDDARLNSTSRLTTLAILTVGLLFREDS